MKGSFASLICAICILALIISCKGTPCTLWVDSIYGIDTNPGSIELPLQTMNGALQRWNSDFSDRELILQLSPGRYRNNWLKLRVPSLVVTSCTECPSKTYTEERATFESFENYNLAVVESGNVTFANISVIGIDISYMNVLNVARTGSVTLLNVSIANVTSTHSVVVVSLFGSLKALNSRFEDCTLTTNHTHILSVIASSSNSQLNFESCLFQFNRLIMHTLAGEGGVCVNSHGILTMSHTTIRHNSVETNLNLGKSKLTGGAVLVHATNDSVTLSSTTFENNSMPLFNTNPKEPLETYGGGLLILAEGSRLLAFSGLVFRNNSALYGGGMAIITTSFPSVMIEGYITDSLFESNFGLSGSALYIQRPDDQWEISDTVFTQNTIAEAIGADQRAATVAIFRSSRRGLFSFERCSFEQNRMQSNDFIYGAAYGTALSLYTESRITISSCNFSNHMEPIQWPLIVSYYIAPPISISNSTFVNNSDTLISILPGDGRITSQDDLFSKVDPWHPIIDANTPFQGDYGSFGDPSRSSVVIRDNHFEILLLPHSSEQPKISISARTGSGIIFYRNTFVPHVDSTNGPGSPLIAVQGFATEISFFEQRIPFLPMHVYVAGVPSVELQSCDWKIPLNVQKASVLKIVGSSFSTPTGPAIRAADLVDSLILSSNFVYNVASDSGSALKFTNTRSRVIDCLFLHNWSSRRGTIESDSPLLIQESTFYNNSAMLYGGAIWTSKALEVYQSHFEHNLASLGGAIYTASGSLDIAGSTFIQNSASRQGGAIMAEPAVKFQIQTSVFQDNLAISQGGAIAMGFKGSLTAYNVTFERNEVFTVPQSDSYLETESTPIFNKNAKQATSDHPRRTSLLIGEDAIDSVGGSISMIQAESLLLSFGTFKYGTARNGPFISLQGLPINMEILHSTFSDSAGAQSGAISILPIFPLLCNREYPVGSVRMIENCTFSDLMAVEGAAIYLNPCESFSTKSMIPLVNITSCRFERLKAVRGSAIFVTGFMSQYLNWNNSTIRNSKSDQGGSVLFFDMEVPQNEPLSNQIIIHPAGCEHCVIASDVSIPHLASTGYFLHTPDGWVSSWTISKHILRIEWSDLYEVGLKSAKLTCTLIFATSDPEHFSIFSSSKLSMELPQTLPISLNASRIFAQPSIYLGTSATLEAAITKHNEPLFKELFVEVQVSDTSPVFPYFFQPNTSLSTILRGCDIGNGIQPHPSLENTHACDICPVGSYNILPSGSCYLCNDPSSTIQKASCVGSEVIGRNGYFVGFSMDSNKRFSSNRIWTHACNYKFCDDPTIKNPCHDSRQGYMCAECTDGKKESLLFSLCGSCASDSASTEGYRTPKSFIAVAVIAWILIIAVVHIAANRNFFVTLAGLLTVQQLLIYPRQYVSTVLPHGMSLAIVRWMCIAPSTAIARATLFATITPVAIPLTSVLLLMILVLLSLVFKLAAEQFRKCQSEKQKDDELRKSLISPSGVANGDFSDQDPGSDIQDIVISQDEQEGPGNPLFEPETRDLRKTISVDLTPSIPSWTSIQSVILTCWTLVILTVTPIIQTLIEYSACEPASENRLLWVVAPSVSCHDPVFIRRRRVAMDLGLFWVVLVLGATALASWKIPTHKLFRSFSDHAFKHSKWHPTVWILGFLLTNVTIGVLTSTSYWYDEIARIGVPIVFMLPSGMIMLLRPLKGTFMNGVSLNLSFVASSISLIAATGGNSRNSQSVFHEASQLYLTLLLWLLYLVAVLIPSVLLKKLSNTCRAW